MVNVRLANIDDYLPVARLHTKSWQENYRGIYSDFFLDNEVEDNRIEVWYERFHQPSTNQFIFIAENERELAGFSCIYLDDDPNYGSLVDNLHVCADFRKKGVGRILLNECGMKTLSAAKVKRMYLWVFENNYKAIAFYERMNGALVETVEKENEDGSKALVRRYCWG
ncbi:GNAT family N-acetyltransferase [Pollutibacter soli]|uniref:GNAT family N-acetyltransferase n=1 Tax=Pollutibacter soli TaxID=3034157 RepID=UPI003013E5B1